MNNIYSVTYSKNGFYVKTNTTISNSSYSLSNPVNLELYNQSGANNIATNTADGKIIGPAPAVGESVTFSVTANISVGYNFNNNLVSSSTSSTVNVTLPVLFW